MAYSTPAMVRQALVPSSDGSQPPPENPTFTAADLSDEQLADAINEADSTIDSYIGRFYAVPVAAVLSDSDEDGAVGTIPHPIDYWSRNLAAYFATISYRGSQDFADSDPVQRRYDATMAALKMVVAGTAQLQLPRNMTDNAATGAAPAYNPYAGDLFTIDYFDLAPARYPMGPAPFWDGRFL